MSSFASCDRRRRGLMLAALLLSATANCAHAQDAANAATGAVGPDPNVVRVWAYVGFGPLLQRWETAFTALHPEVHFHNELHGPAVVMAGLYDRVGDVALMGRELWPVETMAYHWVYQQNPFGVTVATAALDAPGQAFTPVLVVNAANPLSNVTLAQLDAIYGSEHRNAPANIRTWGELGLTGVWADKPIHAYGYGPEDALGVFFRHDVLKMDFKPNPESRLLSDRDSGTRAARPAAERIAAAVSADRFAIGVTRNGIGSGTKTLRIDDVPPDAAAVASHAYPLTRSVGMYFLRFADKPVRPPVEAFVRFVLSAPGQALITSVDGVVALSPAADAQQQQRMDAPLHAGPDKATPED